MKFVFANWGSRGEVEPFAAIGRELVHRGHEVHVAVAPEMVGFVESAGPTGVAYGPDLEAVQYAHHDFWTYLFGSPWRVRDLARLLGEVAEPLGRCRAGVRSTLTSLVHGADLLLTGMNYSVAKCGG